MRPAIKNIKNKKISGLTLIEILIAMIIFSIIAIMGYGGLSNVINLQGKQQEIQNNQEDLQRVLLIMARDFYQIVPRSVRDNDGKRIAAVRFDSNNNLIEFTKSGNAHPITFNRSQFLRVSYSLEGNELYRNHWLHLDRTLGTVPIKNLMLKDVDKIVYRFLDGSGTWSKMWSPKDTNTMPSAIELTLIMNNGRQYLHLFPIVQYN